MQPTQITVGTGRHPVTFCDRFSGSAEKIRDLAAALAPFPRDRSTFYPGLRQELDPTSGDATSQYVDAVMRTIAPIVTATYRAEKFSLTSASFSIVTTTPDSLLPMQRVPHYDSVDPNHVAVIHYLATMEGSGTAFFRQKSTGIERVDATNVDTFVAAAKASVTAQPDVRYIAGSDESYEEIGRVDAVSDRLVFYQGSLLHSAIIPPAMPLDPDPRKGRLTANFFLRLHRSVGR